MTDAPTLKQVVDSSSQLTNLALAILGGTVAAVISSSYVRPAVTRLRLIYLLFAPGWISIALSLRAADELLRGYLAFLMTPNQLSLSIASEINDAFISQRRWLFWAVIFFMLWLFAYLYLWIFSPTFVPEKKS